MRNTLPLDWQDQTFFLTCDGEDCQIAAIEDDEVSRMLNENKIDVGKGCASCSGTVGNAADRSGVFCSAKMALKHSKQATTRAKLDNSDPSLHALLTATIKSHQPNISSAMRNQISEGLIAIVKALEHVLTLEMTQAGFEKTGLYAYRNSDNKFGPCFDRVMSNYKGIKYL